MTVLMILGSRNPEGQTARAGKAFLEGLADEDRQGEEVFLPQMKMERCRQCEGDGWGICRTGAGCVIDDDFALLVDKVKKADAVVFATPVYFGDLSESMRAFLDRLRRVAVRDESDQYGISGKPAIGICVAGGGGGGAPACAVSLERVLSRCGFGVVDVVPVRRQNLDMKLGVLRATGKWLVTCVLSECDS